MVPASESQAFGPYTTEAVTGFVDFATRKGHRCTIEPATGFCACIEFGPPASRRHFVIGADLGLNTSSAQRVCEDKLFAESFLRSSGLTTIPTTVVTEPSQIVKMPFAYPVIVKPNRGHGGEGVLRVTCSERLPEAAMHVRRLCPQVLIQPQLEWPEYRLVVLNGRFQFAYRRHRLILRGDGATSIRALLAQTNASRRQAIHVNPDDFRIRFHLADQSRDIDDVPPDGNKIAPFANANLTCGGTWEDCSDLIHDHYRQMAIRATNALGLIVAGIDLFAENLADPQAGCALIEVNANPGFAYLRHHPDRLDRFIADAYACLAGGAEKA